jgi:hypothetical protein
MANEQNSPLRIADERPRIGEHPGLFDETEAVFVELGIVFDGGFRDFESTEIPVQSVEFGFDCCSGVVFRQHRAPTMTAVEPGEASRRRALAYSGCRG